MSHIITDGTGTKNKTKVDSTNALKVRGVTESASIESLGLGNQYILHSTVMNMQTASNSYLAYFENLETLPFIINTIQFSSEKSNESTGTPNAKQTGVIRVRRNPVGPSVSQDWFTNNAAFGSPNSLSRTAVTGGFGAGGGDSGTFTDNGDLIVHDLVQFGSSILLVLDELILETNNSLGLGVQPPDGNTDVDVHFTMIGYLKGT